MNSLTTFVYTVMCTFAFARAIRVGNKKTTFTNKTFGDCSTKKSLQQQQPLVTLTTHMALRNLEKFEK